jgi:hypothetical protein
MYRMSRWYTLAGAAALVLFVSCDFSFKEQPRPPLVGEARISPAEGRRGTTCTISFYSEDYHGYPDGAWVEVRSAPDSSGPFQTYDVLPCGEGAAMPDRWRGFYGCTWKATWPGVDTTLPCIRIYPMASNGQGTTTGKPVSFRPLKP